jgi:photosystem II stability/assembly factor-like uncharacterized protein
VPNAHTRIPGRALAALLMLLVSSAALGAAERWVVQYFHDEKDSTLAIQDLKFPSLRRGVAVGVLTSRGKKSRPVSLTTSDGGATWTTTRTQEFGRSLFFLNDSVGWMVTYEGLWKTFESGRSWTKLPRSAATKWVRQVCFLDENKGWAVGERKSVYLTLDGGKKWSPVDAVDKVNTKPENTIFRAIAFADALTGLIVGQSAPPAPPNRLPDYLQPERSNRREQPHLMIVLETRDGGRTWKPAVTSVFGQVTKVALLPDGTALSLFQFRGGFAVPAEMHAMNWKTGSTTRAFAGATRAITDIALTAKGTAYAVAIEPPGKMNWGPVPGKLKVLRSVDLKVWTEMQVDYRAVGTNAVLAVVDESHAWIATDTGMILRLQQD